MIVSYVIGGVILLMILVYTLAGVAWVFTDLIPEAYRTLRYDRKGICYKCKHHFTEWASTPADQTWGPDRITQGRCACGNVSMPRGNRRFADWADF